MLYVGDSDEITRTSTILELLTAVKSPSLRAFFVRILTLTDTENPGPRTRDPGKVGYTPEITPFTLSWSRISETSEEPMSFSVPKFPKLNLRT